MSSRRAARSAPKTTVTGVPAQLVEEAFTGGFWDSRAKVEAWCERQKLERPPQAAYDFPPGLRQLCIRSWASREGLVTRWGTTSREQLAELGVSVGPGKDLVMARHSHLFSFEALNTWRT